MKIFNKDSIFKLRQILANQGVITFRFTYCPFVGDNNIDVYCRVKNNNNSIILESEIPFSEIEKYFDITEVN